MNTPPLDLVLINPGGRARAYQGLGRELAAIEPPIWAGLMATYVRRKGFSVEILDANALELGPEETAENAVAMNPRLIAVVVYGHNPSASTQVMPGAGAICKAIKERAPERSLLLVGGHVAALPERTLNEETADFVCTGEGPVTLADLLQALQAHGPVNLADVRGLLYRIANETVRTPPAPNVQDLDGEMPGMAWDLLPMTRYRAHNWHAFGYDSRRPYAALYTTLGCPFRCSFCCIQAPFKPGDRLQGLAPGVHSYRRWGVEGLLRQIDDLVQRHGVRHIKFADEIFVLNPAHVNGLCDGLIARGYDLNIWAYARVDTIKPAMADKLRKAGIRWLAYGFESGSERVRKDVNKGYAANDVPKAVALTRNAGLYIIGNFIFGLPEDDLDTMQETLDLALEMRCEFVNFNCTMAYPGSALYELAVKEGWPLPTTWSGYAQHAVDSLPLPTRHLQGPEVLKFRDEAFRTYFADPAYLEMVRAKFGAATLAHVRDMASHTLERRCTPSSVVVANV